MTAVFRVGDHTVRKGDSEAELTPMECQLLGVLAQRPGRVVSHGMMRRNLWPLEQDEPLSAPNEIQVVKGRLLKKLAAFGLGIRTRRGVGFVLDGDIETDWSAA